MYDRKTSGWMKYLDFILLDLICLLSAYMLTYFVRHGEDSILYWNGSYTALLLVLSCSDVMLSILFNPFHDVLRNTAGKDLAAGMKLDIGITACTTLYLYLAQEGFWISRTVLILTFTVYPCLSFLIRTVYKRWLRKAKKSIGKKSLLIISDEHFDSNTYQDILSELNDSMNVVGFASVTALPDSKMEKCRACGEENILDYVCRAWVDEVLLLVPADRLERAIVNMGVPVHHALFAAKNQEGISKTVQDFGGYSVITSSLNVMEPWQKALKRAADILMAIVGCVFTRLFAMFLFLPIKAASPGPVFFKQERIGRNGKKFRLYKFRTMQSDAEEMKKVLEKENEVSDGMMFKIHDDPRIIGSRRIPDGTYKKGIGNFMRDLSIDEFPQFLNVLKGDMSVVGTRPPTLDVWERYGYAHRTRLAVKPGITGMWQVNGRSRIKDFEKVVELDRQYIENWSLLLDIRILVKTVKVVFKKEGAS